MDELKHERITGHRGHRAHRRRPEGTGRAFKELIKERTGKDFPDDPVGAAVGAIGAVFGSWMNDRAIVYRRKYGIPARVGHGRQRAGDGLRQHGRRLRHRRRLHARPGHRREGFYGDYLINAQGEDVVAGIRTPEQIARAEEGACRRRTSELEKIRKKLEKHFKDVQDIEFTIEKGKLACCRRATASAPALAA